MPTPPPGSRSSPQASLRSDTALDGELDAVLDAALAETLARGQAVADARRLSDPLAGSRMLVWPAGQVRGDLGEPRLNQRAALYAEALLDKIAGGKAQPPVRKTFAGEAASAEVLFTFYPGRRDRVESAPPAATGNPGAVGSIS